MTFKDIKVTWVSKAYPADQVLLDWLQAAPDDCQFLLAHQRNGVVWGRRLADGSWAFSSGLTPNSPALVLDDLLQLRVFGSRIEILLWRDTDGLWTRAVHEDEAQGQAFQVQEDQTVLWGTARTAAGQGFTCLTDGAQGLAHAVPIDVPEEAFTDGRRPVGLFVRHFIDQDAETGLAQVVGSRLVKVGLLDEEKGNA